MSDWVKVAENIYRRDNGQALYFRGRIGGVSRVISLGKISLTEAKKIRDERRVKTARAIANLDPEPERKAGERPKSVLDLLLKRLENYDDRAPGTVCRGKEHTAHMKKNVGHHDAASFSKEDWYAYRRKRKAEGAKAGTINRELSFLLAALAGVRNFTREEKREMRLAEPEPGSRAHEFTESEVESILAAATPRMARFFTILAETGCRRGELALAARTSVDDLDGADDPGITFAASTTKGRRGRRRSRWVPLSDGESYVFRPAVGAVREQLSESARQNSQWLFPSPTDPRRPVSEHCVYNYWSRLRTRLGIKARIHDFRHTFITMMLLRGYSPSVVAKIVGHSSTQMIDRNYGHLFRHHREDMVRAIRGGERPQRPRPGNILKFSVRTA